MGAHSPNYNMTDGEKAFIRKCNSNCVAFLFVCASFMAALQTGLLESKTATAPRFMLEQLRNAHPGVKWVEKLRPHDGKIWTTGTLLNDIDMTQAFALETCGGKGSLVELVVRLGGYPCRDIDYADVPWKF
jgi:transcriptional regulator GlxA family with amidase domain